MKLVIIEDQTLIQELLVMACRASYPSAEIHAAANASLGLELCRRHSPDIVLLDIVLPDRDGVEIMPQLRLAAADAKILALSSHIDDYTLHRAFAAGINGFVDKNVQTLDVLRDAVNTVLEGRVYASTSVVEARARMRADSKCFAKLLSDRELELLRYFGYGKTNEEVALVVELSPRTVRNHRHNIMTKLGLKSTPQLIRYALEKGFNHGRS